MYKIWKGDKTDMFITNIIMNYVMEYLNILLVWGHHDNTKDYYQIIAK